MNAITVIILIFFVLGALDKLAGDKFGLGKEFSRGFILFEAMALFDEAAADERDAAVEQYVMCLQCLWSFYRVQGMQRDKREAMLSRLDVLLPHERAWPKDFEKGIRCDN